MASTSNTSSYSKVEEFTPSASTSGRSYDVFINHRGPDVKHTLATGLYKMLTSGMGLRVFLDSEELELGDYLPRELDEAIKSASLHIAIFSKNYAQSRWCLEELSSMLRTGTKIVPIFYHVKPEDVRYAREDYAAAFERHKKTGRYTPEKLKEWKDALHSVSHNIGHVVNTKADEDMLLKNITYCVEKEIKKFSLVVAEHPVGLDEIVKDFESSALQSDGSCHNVQVVGIWGMGGSGKTTLAKELYNNIYPSMEKASLLLDVRDAANKNLLHKQQEKLLKDLGFKSVSVDNIEEGKAILASQLRSVRALIVLDDVDHVDQLNALLPVQESRSLIGSGTLIVVTTRELEVLRHWSISSQYKMKPLNAIHAQKLFCWHAFLQPSPTNGFEELVEKFLEACSGLPLSLKVLGGQLYRNLSKDYWESLLEKISRIVPEDIKKKLKISYDALDDEEKEAFLDAACFLIGEKSNLAIEVWNGSGWNGFYNLERLKNKCLVEIDEKNLIRMHDHLRDLGRGIANEQSPYRLWFRQQTIKVHNGQNGIGIRGIVATPFRTELDYRDSALYDYGSSLPAEEFGDCSSHAELMVNTSKGIWTLAPSRLGLNIIVARGRSLYHVISVVSRDLVWLRWFDSEQKNLQSLILLKKLRVLQLYENLERENHHLQELWLAECNAPLQLRELVISHCTLFQGFPKSIGRLEQLKKIVLDSTEWMQSLPEEFCLLKSLEHLDLIECRALTSLPNSMGNLSNLRHLSLRQCEKLRRLPDSFKKLTLLQHLDLFSCSNLTLNSDIMENMSKLEYLDFSCCHQLEELPRHITNQASLRELDLTAMGRLREVPMKIDQLSKLRKLSVGGHSLTSLPDSLGDLSSLTRLLIYSSRMEYLPDSLGRLSLLESLEIGRLKVKSLPESIIQLINLESLSIYSCLVSELNLGAGSFSSSLCKLRLINLSENNKLSKISISEDCCTGLETLSVGYNTNLTEIDRLPSSVRNLFITENPKLSALPSFAQLTSLQQFEMTGCYQVKEIQGLQHCRELEVLKAYTRWKVPCIQSLECMERLRTLHLTAMSKSVVEGCIQTVQKWPGEIIICTRAVPKAASLVNSFAFPTLSVIDSCSNVDTFTECELLREQPTNGNAIIVCFLVVCTKLMRNTYTRLTICDSGYSVLSEVELKQGKWVWIGVFTQRSEWYTSNAFRSNGTVQKGFLATVEQDRVMEALHSLLRLMKK